MKINAILLVFVFIIYIYRFTVGFDYAQPDKSFMFLDPETSGQDTIYIDHITH